MFTIFEKIIIGHLVGDYMFQTKKMALEKSAKNWHGLITCTVHCLIYTAAVCLFTASTAPLKISLIFLSHFPIDRWSLANKWLDLIKGRNFITAYKSTNEHREIDLIFSAIVYVVVDNTMHILLLAVIFYYFQ